MIKKRRRVFALALALCLISTLLPLSALADSITRELQPESGLEYYYNGNSRPKSGDNSLTVMPKYENDVVNMRQYQLQHTTQGDETYWSYCSDMGTPAQQTGGPNFDENKLYKRINLETFLNDPKYDSWDIITGASRKNTAERLRAILLAANVLESEAGRAELAQKAGVEGTLSDEQIIAAAQISIWKLANNQVFKAGVAALADPAISKLETYFYSLKGVAYAAQVEVVGMQKMQNPSEPTYDLFLRFRVSGEGVKVQEGDIQNVSVTWKDDNGEQTQELELVSGAEQEYTTTLTGLKGTAKVDLAVTLNNVNTVYLFVPNQQSDTQTLLSVVNGTSKLQTRVEVTTPEAAALSVSKLWRNDGKLDFATPVVKDFASEFVVYHDDRNVVDADGNPMLSNVVADSFTIMGNDTHTTERIFEVGKNYRIEEQATNTGGTRVPLETPMVKYFKVVRNNTGGEPTILWTEKDYVTEAYATNFVNTHTMPLGGVVVEKKVTGTRPTAAKEEDKAQNHVFNFKALYDNQPMADTDYTLYKPVGTESNGDVKYEKQSKRTSAEGVFALQDGEKAAFSGLEVGKAFTVEEPEELNRDRVGSYTLAQSQTHTIQEGQEKTLLFTNLYNTGSLTLNKQMSGAIAKEDMDTVTFVLKGADGYEKTATASSFTEGAWSHTFTDLPYGQYSITEQGAQRTGYTLAVTVDGEKVTPIEEDKWSVAGTLNAATAEHSFTNAYSNKGIIELSKLVESGAGATVDPNKEYAITITGDKPWTEGVLLSEGARGEAAQDQMSYTVWLKKDATVRLSEVPSVGYQYTVSEAGAELSDHALKTAFTVSLNKAPAQVKDNFALSKGATAQIKVTNAYSRDTANLTVSKSWADSELGWDFFKKGVKITITGPLGSDGKNYTDSVVLTNDQPHTFQGIPTGTYSVTEEIVALGSYKLEEYQATNSYKIGEAEVATGTSADQVAVSKASTATVAFHNKYTRDRGDGKFSLTIEKKFTGKLGWDDFKGGVSFEVLGPVDSWGDGVTAEPEGVVLTQDTENKRLYTLTLTAEHQSVTLSNILAGEYQVSEKRFLPKGNVVTTLLNGSAAGIASTTIGKYDREKEGTTDTVVAKPVKVSSVQPTPKMTFGNGYSGRAAYDVTVEKKVVGEQVDPNEKFGFTITFDFSGIQGSNGKADRDRYYEQLADQTGWKKIDDGEKPKLECIFSLAAGGSRTFERLPDGVKYTVKETKNDNYSTSYVVKNGDEFSAPVDGSSADGTPKRNVAIEFTNTRVYPVTMTKEVLKTDGTPIKVDSKLEIQLGFGDRKNNERFSVEKGQATGSKDTRLPAGVYEVKEIAPVIDSVITDMSGAEYSLVRTDFPNGNPVTIAKDSKAVVKVQNVYQRTTGDLTLAKEFTGDLAGDAGWDKFGTVSFTVAGPDANWLEGKTLPEGVSAAPVTDNAKAYAITLSKTAPSVTLTGIPTGKYTVTEQPLTLEGAEKNLYTVEISHAQNGETATAGEKAEVLVQKNAAQTITYYNQYTRLKGNLTLNKIVNGPDDGSDFAITVTFTGDKPGSFDEAKVQPGVLDDTARTYSYTARLKHQEGVTFKEIPTGTTYTVSEPNPGANYSKNPEYSYISVDQITETAPKPIAEDKQGRAQGVVVTNTRNTGTVQVSKALAEGDAYKGSFAFTLSSTDGKIPLPLNYTLIDGAGREEQQLGPNGSFSLKNGQSAEFSLYVGAEYQVVEAEQLYFTPEYSVEGTPAEGAAVITVDANEEQAQQILITNARKDLDATLKVTKKVDYGQVLEGSALEKDAFVFQIGKGDAVPFAEDLEYTIGEDEKLYQTEGGLFTLKNGQTAEFKLPAGVYSVGEISEQAAGIEYHTLQVAHQVNDNTTEQPGKQLNNWELHKDKPLHVTFINRYIPKKTKLTVLKDYATVNDANPDFSFLLEKEVKQPDGTRAWEAIKASGAAADTFVLKGGATQIFEDLVPGEYRLTEKDLPKIESASLLHVAFDRNDDEIASAKVSPTEGGEYVYEFTIAKGASEEITLGCTNMYQKDAGKILVTKTIAEGSYDSGDDFHFALLDAEGQNTWHKDITYRLHGTSCTWTPEAQKCSQTEGVCFDGTAITGNPNETGEFALKAGERLVISGLDTGKDYHVKENLSGDAYALQDLRYAAYNLATKSEDGKETWVEGEAASKDPTTDPQSIALPSVKDGMHHVDFTNSRQTGEIVVKKTVVGPVTEDLSYPIALRFTNEKGKAVADHAALGLTYDGGTPREVNAAGIFVELEHEQAITVRNIPAGLYCIVSEENTNADGFSYEVNQTKEGTLIAPTTEGKEPEQVTVTNTVRLGSMKIQKSLQTPDEALMNFAYEITVEFENTLGKWTADPTESYFTPVGAIVPTSTEYVENNIVRMTFALKHGEQAEIQNVPAGLSYVVTEAEYENNASRITNGAGTTPWGVDDDKHNAASVSVIVYNYNLEAGDLVVSKEVKAYENLDDRSDMFTQDFPFELRLFLADIAEDSEFMREMLVGKRAQLDELIANLESKLEQTPGLTPEQQNALDAYYEGLAALAKNDEIPEMIICENCREVATNSCSSCRGTGEVPAVCENATAGCELCAEGTAGLVQDDCSQCLEVQAACETCKDAEGSLCEACTTAQSACEACQGTGGSLKACACLTCDCGSCEAGLIDVPCSTCAESELDTCWVCLGEKLVPNPDYLAAMQNLLTLFGEQVGDGSQPEDLEKQLAAIEELKKTLENFKSRLLEVKAGEYVNFNKETGEKLTVEEGKGTPIDVSLLDMNAFLQDGESDSKTPLAFELQEELGVLRFALKHDQAAIFLGLPIGVAYTVEELSPENIGPDKYEKTEASLNGESAPGLLVEATTKEGSAGNLIHFVNHYDPKPKGQVTVQKIWGANVAASDYVPVTITLYENGANPRTVTLGGGQGWSHTFSDLDLGNKYLMVESALDGFAVSYSNPDGLELKYQSKSPTMSVTNSRTEIPPENPPEIPPGRPDRDPSPPDRIPPLPTEPPTEPPIDIPEPDVPLADAPPVAPEEEILEELPEPEIPLGEAPQTGDDSGRTFSLVASILAFGLSLVLIFKRPEEKES